MQQDSAGADRVIRAVFHPEFSFSDFVGYLCPQTAYRIDCPKPVFSPDLVGTPLVYYSFVCGPLLEAYLLSVLNPQHRVVLIIEELSRAPAALVFGDILQLLDRVQPGEHGAELPPTGFSRYEIRPKGEIKKIVEDLEALPSRTSSGCMRFPSNLYIWATMNRADQNARQLDTAFLRRWTREHTSHQAPGLHDSVKIQYAKGHIEWGRFRNQLNALLLESDIKEDKLIGPHFLALASLNNMGKFADDLLAYVWYDILRENGGPVFGDNKTFSDIRDSWVSGTLIIGGIAPDKEGGSAHDSSLPADE